jgi:hypothetical protein
MHGPAYVFVYTYMCVLLLFILLLFIVHSDEHEHVSHHVLFMLLVIVCVCMCVGVLPRACTYRSVSLSAQGPTYLRVFHQLEDRGCIVGKNFFSLFKSLSPEQNSH